MPRPKRALPANSNLIRSRRLLLGWTQEHLAELAGIDRNRVVDAENGRPLDPSTLRDIARPLGLTFEDLVGRSEESELQGFMATIHRKFKEMSPDERAKAFSKIVSYLGISCLVLAFFPGCEAAVALAVAAGITKLFCVIRCRLAVVVPVAALSFAVAIGMMLNWSAREDFTVATETTDDEAAFSEQLDGSDPELGYLVLGARESRGTKYQEIKHRLISALESEEDIPSMLLHREGDPSDHYEPVALAGGLALFYPLEPGNYEFVFLKHDKEVIQSIKIAVKARKNGGTRIDMMYVDRQLSEVLFGRSKIYDVIRSK